jgi:hypothetical protein
MGSHSDIDIADLIPELRAWNNGRGIHVEAWVGCTGSFELAVGYSRLFWPDFVEYEGCIFFASFSRDSYLGFMKQCNGDRRRVEAVMNHKHVFDYFSHSGGAATKEQIIYLGRVLRDIWRMKLARDFPGRGFIVSFADGPCEELLDYEISFWQASAQDLPRT